jgi:hypothetical protein
MRIIIFIAAQCAVMGSEPECGVVNRFSCFLILCLSPHCLNCNKEGSEYRLLAFFLAKPTQNAELILKTREIFICGDMHYITNSFHKNLLKIVTT